MSDKKYIWKIFDFKGDSLDLLDLFRAQPHVFFLDSSQHDPHRGRYSFIGFDPFDIFICKGGNTLDRLKKRYRRYAGINSKEYSAPFSPLTSGIVGCLNYDYGLHQEKIRPVAKDDLQLPDCFFGFYDCILTIDHFTQKLIITSSGLPEQNQYLRDKRAKQRLDCIIEKCELNLPGTTNTEEDVTSIMSSDPFLLECNISKERYIEMVQKALDYISCGDIYQVNLSQRFELDLGNHVF